MRVSAIVRWIPARSPVLDLVSEIYLNTVPPTMRKQITDLKPPELPCTSGLQSVLYLLLDECIWRTDLLVNSFATQLTVDEACASSIKN